MTKNSPRFLSNLFSLGLGCIGLFCLLGCGGPPSPEAKPVQERVQEQAAEPPVELRGFWVDAFNPGFKTPEQVSKLVADVKKANGNTIIAQVRRRADAYYTSDREPRSNDPDLAPDFDALQDLIDKASAEGIEVHAWLATLPAYKKGYTTTDPSHVWQRHGPEATGRDNWAMLDRAGEAPGYLDPGHPDAVDYTISIYLDVLQRYDVDGLHLDYIRYDGTDMGYNPTALARFNRLTGRTGIPAADDPDWMQWRREQVSNLVRKLYIKSLAIKPEVKITAAVIAWGAGPDSAKGWEQTRTYREVFQDWRAWLEEGILDIAMPMVYHIEDKEKPRQWYDQWIEFAKNNQYNRYVTIGVGSYLNYIENNLNQIRRAQKPSATGNTAKGQQIYSYASSNVYSNADLKRKEKSRLDLPRQPWQYAAQSNDWFYRSLSEPSSYVDPATGKTYETEPVWEAPARPPDLPWKSQPTKGAIMGTVELCPEVCDSVGLQLENLSDTSQTHTIKTDGSGWFGAISLEPGIYKITVDLRDRPSQQIEIQPGQVAEVAFE